MSIMLDTPEQINAWVLLSRISQCHMHMAGYPVKGLAKWLKANVPDVTTETTVKAMYPRLLDYCDTFNVQAPGGEQCNYQVLVTPTALNGLYFDRGVNSSMENLQNDSELMAAYAEGRVVIMRTMEDVRGPDKTIQMVKG